MAKVTITFEDETGGDVASEVKFDPPLPEDTRSDTDLTPAQSVAICTYIAVTEASAQE